MRTVLAILFSLGAGARAWPAAPESWKFQTDLGVMRPEGSVGQALGHGFDVGFSVGRRTFSTVIAEAGVRFGDMSLSGAQTVTGTECIPSRPGGILCVTGPATQRGTLTSGLLGLSFPLQQAGPLRFFQLGAGGLVGKYAISPGGQGLGSRTGPGYYLTFAVEPLPIGGLGRAGLLLRGTRVDAHGSSLGTTLPSRGSDTWLEINVSLRLGPGGPRQ